MHQFSLSTTSSLWFWILFSICFLPHVGAVTPFMETVALVDHYVPGLSTYAIYVLLHTIYLNHQAIHLNHLYIAATSNRARAWLLRLAEWSFLDPELVEFEQESNILAATDAIAMGFGISGTYKNLSPLHSHQTLLVPLYRKCELCSGGLKQDRETQDVWIVTEGGFIEGRVVAGRCRTCRATHFPDRYTTQLPSGTENTILCAVYNNSSTHLRIGRNLWADRSLARTMTGLRYSGHMSNEALAQNFNDRHYSSHISLSAKQVWKLFVLHESISKCSSNGINLIVPAYTKVHEIAGTVNNMFHPGFVKVIPGALSHHCTECHHPHRTGFPPDLLPNAATNPVVASEVEIVCHLYL